MLGRGGMIGIQEANITDLVGKWVVLVDAL
jgi:hypothetical protein